MIIRLNAKARKKELVKALEEINNAKAEYLGTPSFVYKIGEATVTREGNVETEDENLKADLAEYGFAADGIEEAIEKLAKAPTIESIDDEDSLTLSFPDTGFDDAAFERLTALVNAKAGLLTNAFDALSTEILWNKEEGRISFPWFRPSISESEDEKLACILFLNKLMWFAKTVKRVTAKEKETDNEKYAFRCFLLRLGFIGNEYKGARKIFLSRLSGNSAFKSGKEHR